MENCTVKIRRHLLPVELIAEVAHWLHGSECAELDPVSTKFDSFTNVRAMAMLNKVSIKYRELCRVSNLHR